MSNNMAEAPNIMEVYLRLIRMKRLENNQRNSTETDMFRLTARSSHEEVHFENYPDSNLAVDAAFFESLLVMA